MISSRNSKIVNFAQEYYLSVIGIYILLAISFYFILYKIKIITAIPDAAGILKWDTGIYYSIKKEGYHYIPNTICNAGFFPLFPYFWKISGLGTIAMSILCALIFFVGVSLLFNLYKPKNAVAFLFLCLPFGFFFYVPQTESIFFLLSVFILIGLKNKKLWLIFLSLYLASMTRASGLFFLIAFAASIALSENKNSFIHSDKWKHLLKIYLTPVVLGICSVGIIQYFLTGNFFAYYDAQTNGWERKLTIPNLPFGTNQQLDILSFSNLNFWFGSISLVIAFVIFFNWLRNKLSFDFKTQSLIISIGFLCMSFFSIVFFNPKWYWVDYGYGGFGATSLTGINRYLECNVFFFISNAFSFKANERL